MKEKYIISISKGGTVYDVEFIGSKEELKKEADHVASLTFYERGHSRFYTRREGLSIMVNPLKECYSGTVMK